MSAKRLVSMLLLRICRTLAAGVVDGVVAGQQELGDGEEGIAILQQRLDDAGQRLRSVQGGVVEQDDGTRLDLTCHPLSDLRRREFLPVQAVPAGSGFKELGLGRSNVKSSCGL